MKTQKERRGSPDGSDVHGLLSYLVETSSHMTLIYVHKFMPNFSANYLPNYGAGHYSRVLYCSILLH
jgi:hypothetical protein